MTRLLSKRCPFQGKCSHHVGRPDRREGIARPSPHMKVLAFLLGQPMQTALLRQW
jgi:hypothetical protein